jgi:hypothetical protein
MFCSFIFKAKPYKAIAQIYKKQTCVKQVCFGRVYMAAN